MLKRKKRIPFDPPGERTGKRRPERTRRAGQIFINRRVLMMRTAVVGGFALLTGRLAQMQIARGDTYQAQAVDNVVSWKERKPTRGLIYDRAGRPLAENRRTWEVRVIPSELPRRGTPEYERVRERLITALRLPDCLIIDRNAVPRGAERTVYTRVAIHLGATSQQDVDDWIAFIEASAKYNYVVLVDRELSGDAAAKIRNANAELPGVEVVNYFDYVVRNFRYYETPVPLKRDVARDVALKLEANRLYLPGVELDDTVLTRRYPGGPVMSHILGYVGKIQDQDLNHPDNILRIDQNGRRYYRVYQPDDYIGQAGIERKLEEVLRGQKGGAYYEQDSSGVVIRELGNSAPAIPGKNLRLTVDLELQAAMSRAISEGIELSNRDRRAKVPEKPANCRGGAVVILSPKTGEVYALVSYPTYDNQLFIDGLSVLKAKEYGLTPDPELDQKKLELGERFIPDGVTEPLTDRAYGGHYAPGSTLKLFVALAGLREGRIDGEKRYTCTGAIKVPWTWNEAQGNNYPCWIYRTPAGQHGPVNVVEALERSCDVFFYNVGTPEQKPAGADLPLHYRDYNMATGAQGEMHFFEGLGIDKIHSNLYKRFWFGEPTRIDLPFEAKGLVPNPAWKQETLKDGWSSGDTINTSIGQGNFLASPLQMAANTACLANGGLILRPKIVHSIVDDQGNEVQAFKPEKLRRLKMEPEHLNLVLEGMRRVVHEPTGTAHASPDPETGQMVTKWPMTNPPGEEEIIIAGKTGTAEVGYQMEDGSYSEAHAWFTCFAPMDDPEVVVTVFLERGGEGSSYAVPIADKALRAYFELTGRRARGAVLREDRQPISDDYPPPSGMPSSEATPEA